MSIRGVRVNCAELDRSVAFYRDLLGADQLVGATDGSVLMGFDGGLVELKNSPAARGQPVPEAEQLRPGLWHIGLRVVAVDPIAERLEQTGTRFYIEPGFNPDAQVRMTFFYDPDGLVIELVEGNLRYTQECDSALADKQRALPIGPTPRFDHVAASVSNWTVANAEWRALGYNAIGHLKLTGDPNGAVLHFLGNGSDVVAELFTYDVPLPAAGPPSARGYAGAIADPAAASLLTA
jgi:catechol 2,3-dioxygenase-like lactoylglutathione lyase family enzyme